MCLIFLRRRWERKGAPGSCTECVEGRGRGAAARVIYFVNIFGPQGPHSRPPWPISRLRLSARESVTSSGYGPFQVSPRSPQHFLSSGEAVLSPTWHCVAVSRPSPAWAPQGSHHPAVTELTLSPQVFPPPHQPCEKSLR